MAKIFDKINLLKTTAVNDNLLINGNFDIWQRGVSFDKTGFSADRWYFSVNTGKSRAYKMTGGGSLANVTNFIRIETISNDSSFAISQPVESKLVSQIRGSYVTLSFYAKLPTTNNNWTGNISAICFYSTTPDNVLDGVLPVSGSSINSTIDKTNTWTKYSVSFLVPANSNTLMIEISSATDLNAGSMLDIAQVKLEQGQSATALSPISYNEELINCKRYYQKISGKLRAGTGYAGGKTARKFSIGIPLQSFPRSSNPIINIIDNESNNIALSNIVGVFNGNNVLDITADSNSPYSELSSVFSIEDEIFPSRVPGPVSNVALIRNSGSIDITWNASNAYNAEITNYSIYYGNVSTNLNNTISIASGLSGQITGTSNILPYYVKIFGINSVGIGDASALYYLGPDYNIPSGIQAISGSWGNDVSNLSWTQPSDDGGAQVTGYIVQRSMYSNFSTIELNYYTINTDVILSKSNNQISSTGTYYYRVAPLNLAGTGTFTTYSLAKTAPKPPNNLSVVPADSKATLTYGLPSGNGGDPVSLINIQYSSHSGFTVPTGINSVANYTPITISPLTNNATIYFRARNLNALGYGDYSDSISVVVNRPATVPLWGAGRGLPSHKWINDIVTPSGVTSAMNLSWLAPIDNGGSPIINYTVYLGADAGFATGLGTFNTINNNPSIDLLSPTGNWNGLYVRVKANNAIGSSSFGPSGLNFTKGLPDPPTLVSLTAGDSVIVMNYKASAGSKGAPITGYRIESSTSSFFSSSVVGANIPVSDCSLYDTHLSATNCSYGITNLTNNTRYYARIRSINSVGTGSATPYMMVIPRAAVATVPSAPLYLFARRFVDSGNYYGPRPNVIYYNSSRGDMSDYYRNTDKTIVVSGLIGATGTGTFAGPLQHTKSNYENIYSESTQDYYRINSLLTKAAVHAGRLTAGQVGTVFIKPIYQSLAFNAPIYTQNNITPSGSPNYYPYIYKFIDGNITCPDNEAINISWSSPINNGGSPITGYVIQTGALSSFAGATSINVPVSVNYSSCATKEDFFIRVAARNSAGTGPYSDSIKVIQTYLAPPDPISIFSAYTSGTINNKYRLVLNWTPPSDFGGTNTLSRYIIEDTRSFLTDIINVSGNLSGINYDVVVPGSRTLAITADNGTFSSSTKKYLNINVANTGTVRPASWVFLKPQGTVVYDNLLITPNPTQTDLINPQARQYGSYVICTGNISGNFLTADFGRNSKIEAIEYRPIYNISNFNSYIPLMTGAIFQGSYDNNNWTTISTLLASGENASSLNNKQIFINSDYRYIRLFVPINADNNISHLQIGYFNVG